jgi:hypothetical protein
MYVKYRPQKSSEAGSQLVLLICGLAYLHTLEWQGQNLQSSDLSSDPRTFKF